MKADTRVVLSHTGSQQHDSGCRGEGKEHNDLADSIQTHTYNHLARITSDQIHSTARWKDREGTLAGEVGLVNFFATRDMVDAQSDQRNQRRDSLRSLVSIFCLPYNCIGHFFRSLNGIQVLRQPRN